jgi:hypothetical protein
MCVDATLKLKQILVLVQLQHNLSHPAYKAESQLAFGLPTHTLSNLSLHKFSYCSQLADSYILYSLTVPKVKILNYLHLLLLT